MDDILDNVVSSSELVRLTGTDSRYVQRQTRRLGMKPVYTKGERQWSRADALRIILLARLQGALGESSALPYEILENTAPEALEELIQGRGTVLMLRTSPLNVVVGVPSVAELVASP